VKSVLRATALLSGSSIVSVVIGLISAKVWALLLGPGGLGYMGLLQSLVGLAGLVAGAGLTTGLVRMGASLIQNDDHAKTAALMRATWLLFWIFGTAILAFMLLFREPISQVMLGGSQHAWAVPVMGIAFLFGFASNLKISTLNAFHRVKVLAQLSILNSAFATLFGILPILIWRDQGIELAVLLGAFVPWALVSWRLKREVTLPRDSVNRQALKAAIVPLLAFGLPYTASMLVGTGVQFVVPSLILNALDAASVGFYRAATAISITYLGFLLSALAMDYYPRVSAVKDQTSVLNHLVNQQHRLVLILAGPLILCMMALAPYLIPLIYSSEFSPAVPLLEWTLVGDVIRFASWTMGFIIVARSKGAVVFAVELVLGIGMLFWSWFGMQRFGLVGAGLAFVITYATHYVLVWGLARKDIGLTLTAENKRLIAATLGAALTVNLLPLVGLETWRTPIALALTAAFGVNSFYLIWHDIGGSKDVRSWLRKRMQLG
jgi:PST family polysaccharide transporter